MSLLFARGFLCFKTGTRKIFSPFQLFCLRYAGIKMIGSSFRLKDNGEDEREHWRCCLHAFSFTHLIWRHSVWFIVYFVFGLDCCVQVRHMNLFMLRAIMRVKMRSLCIWTWLKVVHNCLFLLSWRKCLYFYLFSAGCK